MRAGNLIVVALGLAGIVLGAVMAWRWRALPRALPAPAGAGPESPLAGRGPARRNGPPLRGHLHRHRGEGRGRGASCGVATAPVRRVPAAGHHAAVTADGAQRGLCDRAGREPRSPAPADGQSCKPDRRRCARRRRLRRLRSRRRHRHCRHPVGLTTSPALETPVNQPGRGAGPVPAGQSLRRGRHGLSGPGPPEGPPVRETGPCAGRRPGRLVHRDAGDPPSSTAWA